MKRFLRALRRKRFIIWGAISIVFIAVLITANYLADNQFGSLFDQVFGPGEPIPAKGEVGLPFEADFSTKKDACENGNKVTQEICEEGMVLLKNDVKDGKAALPLAKGAKVSVFGKNSVNLVYGGSGSAAPGDGERKTIFDSLKDAGFSYNEKLEKFYKSSDSGSGRSKNPDMDAGVSTLKTGETPISSYKQDLINSYADFNDAAIVVFSRIAGETWDLPRVASDDASRHYLELDNNERDLLRHIGQSGQFKHVIVLMNGSNYIDLGFLEARTNPTDYNDFGKYVDGAIVIGSPGGEGIMALGRILNGDVNPSGHTVDTVYTKYNEDPTWQNFGGNFKSAGDAYLNASGETTGYFLVEYEENIYIGYRYYETAGKVKGEDWYNSHVVYPFGHGLSYTEFEREVTNVTGGELNAEETFKVSVKVTNKGSVAGKDVVQLYVEAPYTAGGIEKPYKNLVGFAKTDKLAPGASQTVDIEVNPYDFASFDSRDMNNNGFRGWELEKGEYVFHVGYDAHNDIETFNKNLAADAKFEKDPVTGYEVKPLFDEVTEHMHTANMQSLSRNDLTGTFPVTITDEERTVSDEVLKQLKSKDSTNDEVYDKLPTMGAEYHLSLKQLAGKKYDDALWDEFLDQLTFDEMLRLFNEGCYSTAAITRDGIKTIEIDQETGEEKEVIKDNYPIVPMTTSADGPTGIVAFLGNPAVYGCCYYCSECLLAQTYNLKLADKQGNAIGNECLIGDEKHGSVSYPGWYAPAVNIHRSPFSGRNTEYYSEDSFINGKFGGRVIKSVQEKGVYANIKHFALNDQETNRDGNGIATWCDEQAMREIYFKAFEIAVKEGESHGLMTSFNRIGTEWAGGSYRLVTTILRKEWGFQGSVICDFHTKFYMDSKQMLYAGGDINMVSQDDRKLTTSKKYGTAYVTATDPKDANLLRKSAHNNLFAIANSNAMKVAIAGYKTAKWRVALTGATWGVVGLIVLTGAAAFITGFFSKRKTRRERRKEAAAATSMEAEASEAKEAAAE